MRSEAILIAVAAKNNLQVADIIGRSRLAQFVSARREAMQLMKDSGIPIIRIARACQRERTTVLHHVSPTMAARKKAHLVKRRADARATE